MSLKKPQKLNSEEILSNPFLRVNKNLFRFPSLDNKEASYYTINFPHWANIVPVTKEMEVVLVRQYRVGIEDFCLEIPGGIIDEEDKNVLDGIKRELLEETGFKCDKIDQLYKVSANPAFLNNYVYGYLGTGASLVDVQNLDPTEEIEIIKMPIDKIPSMIEKGEIHHPYATLSLVMALNRLGIKYS